MGTKQKIDQFYYLFIVFSIILCSFTYLHSSVNELVSTEKIFCDATIDDDFDDSSVIIVLDRNLSGINKQHNKSFFVGVDIIEIEDLTFVDKGRKLVDEKNFEQVLQLTLLISSKENVLSAIKKLEKIDGIKFAGPNRYLELERIPNDPLFSHNSDPEWNQWGLEKIQVPQAWDITTGSHNIRVGIIDTGIGNIVNGQANHPDLNANLVALGGDFVTMTNNLPGLLRPDPTGHGTHVAGIVGAVGNNGIGISGANWNVLLVPMQVANSSGRVDAAACVRAVTHASNKWNTGERISVLSFSIGRDSPWPDLESAIRQFNGLFVCSTGNREQNNDVTRHYPSFYASTMHPSPLSNMISVGRSNISDQRPTNANWGIQTINIYAPGHNIISTWPVNLSNFSPNLGTGYYRTSGSSMAAPHVTGVAALLLSEYPHFTAPMIKNAILSGADRITISVPGGIQVVRRLNALNSILYPVPIFIERLGPNVAFNTIQSAIEATIDGDIVNINPGRAPSYTGPGNMNINMPLDRSITVRGVGNAEDIVIDCFGGNDGFTFTNVGNRGRIENLTITNAKVGIRIAGGNPMIDGVRFVENEQGLLIHNPNDFLNEVKVSNCLFLRNEGGIENGVALVGYTNRLTIVNSQFIGNRGLEAPSTLPSTRGAALDFIGVQLTLEGNLFEDNRAYGWGANIYIQKTHLQTMNSFVRIRNNKFFDNIAMGTSNTRYQAQNIYIEKGFRFHDIDVSHNEFRIPRLIHVQYPSVNINNSNSTGFPNVANQFRYSNNSTFSNNQAVVDLEIYVGENHAQYRVLLANSTLPGGLHLRYENVSNTYQNNVRIWNCVLTSLDKIVGSYAPHFIKEPISHHILEISDGIIIIPDPDSYTQTLDPLWTSTIKSGLIEAGYVDPDDPWYLNSYYQNPNGTRIDIGAVPVDIEGHGFIRHTLNESLSSKSYDWIAFPYIDKLYQNQTPFSADHLITNLDRIIGDLYEPYQNQDLYRQMLRIDRRLLENLSWNYNDDTGMVTFDSKANVWSSDIDHIIDSRYGYKLQMVNGQSHELIVSGLKIGTFGNPDTEITIQPSTQLGVPREIWVGYFGEGERPLVALTEIADHLIEIKTKNWTISRHDTSSVWVSSTRITPFNFGEAVSLKYVGDIPRTFNWRSNPIQEQSQPLYQQQHYEYIPASYFTFVEESDYIPIFIDLDDEMVSDGGGEIGLFIDDVCYGSEVVTGDRIQLNAYIIDLEITDESVIEFRYHEYIAGVKSGYKKMGMYQILEQETMMFSATRLDLNSGDFFYHISFRDNDGIETPPAIYTTYLENNYPNPFNPSTTISYSIAISGDVKLSVYNIRGQLIRTLVNESLDAGIHSVVWDGDNNLGRSVGSGIYLYKLETSDSRIVKKMLLMK
jgi:hypothetical protein